ncbi:MAG TPA: hypothetical protein VIH99_02835 [Bdellovibrionota bacterium]|jgi:hypothetical protein
MSSQFPLIALALTLTLFACAPERGSVTRLNGSEDLEEKSSLESEASIPASESYALPANDPDFYDPSRPQLPLMLAPSPEEPPPPKDEAKKPPKQYPKKTDPKASNPQMPPRPEENPRRAGPSPVGALSQYLLGAFLKLEAPIWGRSTRVNSWTRAVREIVHARLSHFEMAKDKEIFCPDYANATLPERENCWTLLVSAISKYESSFNPAGSFREPDGNYSVGLLALSPGECPNARSQDALKNAIPNLVCGVNKMASLIRKRGYVDGPASARGASRYWSTLRKPYTKWDPTRNRDLKLGKRDLVVAITKNYRNPARGNPLQPILWVDGSQISNQELGPELSYTDLDELLDNAYLDSRDREMDYREFEADFVDLGRE